MRLYSIFLQFAMGIVLFFLGFVCGLFWQRAEKPSDASDDQRVVLHQEPISTEEIQEDELSEEQQRINEALEDPEFKRVHDFLTRENPMQMNLPGLSQEQDRKQSTPDQNKQEPFRFQLSD